MQPKDVVSTLVEAGRELPAKARKAVLAQPETFAPLLRRLLDEPDRYATKKAKGFGGAHAARLLGELQDLESLPSLIAFFRRANSLHLDFEAAFFGLCAYGEYVAPALLAEPEGPKSFEVARCGVLSSVGCTDPAYHELLRRGFEMAPELYAPWLVPSGMPDAVSLLVGAFDRASVGDGSKKPTLLLRLAGVLEDLPGGLTFDQAAKRQIAVQLWQQGGLDER